MASVSTVVAAATFTVALAGWAICFGPNEVVKGASVSFLIAVFIGLVVKVQIMEVRVRRLERR